MIQRLVLIKLQETWADPESRAEFARHSRVALGALSGVRAVHVGTPADPASEKSWDICLSLTFDSMQDVQSYMLDPAHRAYSDGYLTPRADVKKAWNFDVGGA